MSEVKAEPKSKKGWFRINISLGNDGEDRRVFIGGTEEGDFWIQRGVEVDVPRSVLTRLDDAVQFVDEADPTDENKIVSIARRRFPYTIVRAL